MELISTGIGYKYLQIQTLEVPLVDHEPCLGFVTVSLDIFVDKDILWVRGSPDKTVVKTQGVTKPDSQRLFKSTVLNWGLPYNSLGNPPLIRDGSTTLIAGIFSPNSLRQRRWSILCIHILLVVYSWLVVPW